MQYGIKTKLLVLGRILYFAILRLVKDMSNGHSRITAVTDQMKLLYMVQSMGFNRALFLIVGEHSVDFAAQVIKYIYEMKNN